MNAAGVPPNGVMTPNVGLRWPRLLPLWVWFATATVVLSATCAYDGHSTLAAKSETTLFRVVGPDELSSIRQAGGYTPSPGGLEVKYFYPTAEQAANFAANPANKQFGPFTLTSTEVPTSVINPGNTINVAREGTVITLPNGTLPTLPTPTIHPAIPLPGAP